MKIIGNDGKTYESVKEAKLADEKLAETQAAEKKKEAAEKTKLAQEKKELTAKIEELDKAYDEAVFAFRDAKTEAKAIRDKANSDANEIVKKANAEADEIVSNALQKVREAEKQKADAVVAFNSKFSRPYIKYLTDQDAVEAYRKAVSMFNEFADDILSSNFKLF